MNKLPKHAHADDYGLNTTVNNEVALLQKNKQLDSVSVVTNFASFKEISAGLSALSIDVFLHVNLTEGAPVSPAQKIPSLVNSNGQFLNQLTFIWRCIIGKINANEVYVEIQNQYDRALQSGARIVGLDSHQHVHAFQPVAKVMYDFAADHNIAYVRSYKQVCAKGLSARCIKILYVFLARMSGRGRLPISWRKKSWKNYMMATWQDTRFYSGSVTVVIHPGTNYDRQGSIITSLLRHYRHIAKK
ncbi:MAG: ChbG/HpnK family deacetylase [Candidatus Saccharibacteria bacterium]